MTDVTTATAIGVAFACPPVVLLAGWLRPRLAGPAAAAAAALAFLAVLSAWRSGAPPLQAPWVPGWRIDLHLGLDGLGALFALLATGIGALVAVFATGYMPHHVKHERGLVRFFFLLTLFMAAMVGLAASRDLYSLIVCWDLTAIASFLLIGSDPDDGEARRAARLALVVTGGGAVLLVAAAVVLHVATGHSDLATVTTEFPAGSAGAALAAMIAVAALAKSAQAPLHFWLPRAMVAPTPVSAYLHSAAMVAAGVFLLARLHPMLRQVDVLPPLLSAVGLTSIAVGSLLALAEDDIKRALAYSTVAQYGYVVWMLGMGGAAAATAAAFYVGVHAVAKSGLFLAAGCVTEAAGGERRLSRLGGLGRRLPLLAAAAFVCTAGLTALPLTAGFFKDELLFDAALHRGGPAPFVAVAAAGLTFAYSWRLWSGTYLGPLRRQLHEPGALLVGPLTVLAVLLVIAGVAPDRYTVLAEAAGGVIHGAPAPADTAYHLDLRATNLMGVAAWTLGAAILAAGRIGWRPWTLVARAGAAAGPERLYHVGGRALGWASDRLHALEVRDLRDRAAAVLVPGGVLVAAALLVAPGEDRFVVGTFVAGDLPLATMLVLTALAAVAASQHRRHLPTLLALSLANYGLALAFGFFGAPDVALVAVLVQTVFTLLIVAVLSLFPARQLSQAAGADRGHAPRAFVYTAVATAGAFGFAWTTLSWTARPIASYAYVARAPDAHADDVVTAVLADFRALDTLGEASVLGVAVLGIATVLRWHRSPSR